MIPNKTEVLNLKTRKTQVPMGYLSLILITIQFILCPTQHYSISFEQCSLGSRPVGALGGLGGCLRPPIKKY